MIGNYVGRKVRMYFSKKLNDGHHELVYGLSSHWGSGRGLGHFQPFYDAAWFFQERLIQEFGYHECPSCYWAHHKPEPHPQWCEWNMESRNSKN
jgi:hypothetical protein